MEPADTFQHFPEHFPTEDEIYPADLPSRSFVDLVLGDAENTAPGKFGAYTVGGSWQASQDCVAGWVVPRQLTFRRDRRQHR